MKLLEKEERPWGRFYVLQVRNFNFPTLDRKAIPFWPHSLHLSGQNRTVFPFEVGKLKFHASKDWVKKSVMCKNWLIRKNPQSYLNPNESLPK